MDGNKETAYVQHNCTVVGACLALKFLLLFSGSGGADTALLSVPSGCRSPSLRLAPSLPRLRCHRALPSGCHVESAPLHLGMKRPGVWDATRVQPTSPNACTFHGRQSDSTGQLGFLAEDFLWPPVATHEHMTGWKCQAIKVLREQPQTIDCLGDSG